MKKLSKENTLAEQAYQELRQMIQGFTPGDNKLPSEDDLAKSMGISRATVREALKKLTLEKLINTIHGRGTFAHPSVLSATNRLDINSDFQQMLSSYPETFFADPEIDSFYTDPEFIGIAEPSDFFREQFPDELESYAVNWIYKTSEKILLYLHIELAPKYLKHRISTKGILSFQEFCESNMQVPVDYCIMNTSISQDAKAAERLEIAENRPFICWKERLFNLEDYMVGTALTYAHPDNLEFSIVTRLL